VRAIADPTGPTASGDVMEAAICRLQEAIALLDAIDEGELLAQLPPDNEAALRHQCAVSLLAVLRRELNVLAIELQSASQVQDLIARLARPAPRG
jgi:hypothetical protein